MGEALEEIHADRIDEHAEELAFYFYRSDAPARALDFLQRAAARTADAGHAIELLMRARKVAERAGDTSARALIDAKVQALSV